VILRIGLFCVTTNNTYRTNCRITMKKNNGAEEGRVESESDFAGVRERLVAARPWDMVEIRGYVSSTAPAEDLTVTLLEPDGYAAMVKGDIDILRSVSAELRQRLVDEGAAESLLEVDSVVSMLMHQREGYFASDKSGSGPAYESDEGSSVGVLKSDPDAVFLLRLRVESPLSEPSPAKGHIPRLKQLLTARLDLPTRYYKHAVKLKPGKFKSVRVFGPAQN